MSTRLLPFTEKCFPRTVRHRSRQWNSVRVGVAGRLGQDSSVAGLSWRPTRNRQGAHLWPSYNAKKE